MIKAYTKEQVQLAVSKSESYSDVFRELGIKVNGGSYPWIKKLIAKFDIDTSHFLTANEIASRTFLENRIKKDKTTKDISNGNRISSQRLQNFMKSNGIEHKCICCGLNEWMGNPIRLDVDHIDNNCHNNNINNLQFLCPNCHRQKTIQFTPKPSKNIKFKVFKQRRQKKPQNTCIDCGVIILQQSIKCKSCSSKGTFKIDWPPNDELEKLVWKFPTSKLSKMLGVSDSAIAKRCKLLGITKPSCGYWRKLETNNLCGATEGT